MVIFRLVAERKDDRVWRMAHGLGVDHALLIVIQQAVNDKPGQHHTEQRWQI